MMEDKKYIKISPESIRLEVSEKIFEDINFGVYDGMQKFLTGNTNDFVIPITLTQTYDDMGFFVPFDGYMLQKDIVNNFFFESLDETIYGIKVYNTSEKTKQFLKFSSYEIDWGDGVVETFSEVFPNFKTHTYEPVEGQYTITMTQSNPWGTTKVKKTIYIPVVDLEVFPTESSFTLPNGIVFDYDANNTIESQTSNNFTNIPFTITGYSESHLHELIQYGTTKYQTGKMVKKYDRDYGIVDEITESYTAYTVNGIQYYDYLDGTTIYFVESSGLTEEMLDELPITKEEVLMGIVSSPEIQSGIFIERGKLSGFETLQRLGEVDNIGDLTSYGYGFFKINNI